MQKEIRQKLTEKFLQDAEWRATLFTRAQEFFDTNPHAIKFSRHTGETPFSFIRSSDGTLFCLAGSRQSTGNQSVTAKRVYRADGTAGFLKRLSTKEAQRFSKEEEQASVDYYGENFCKTPMATVTNTAGQANQSMYLVYPDGREDWHDWGKAQRLPDHMLFQKLTAEECARAYHLTQYLTQMVLSAAYELNHFHELGYLHRDVKPQNLTIDDNYRYGRVLLIDMGYSTGLNGKSCAHDTTYLGTDCFKAPFINHCDYRPASQGNKNVYSPQSDFFALGKTLDMMLGAMRLRRFSRLHHAVHAMTRNQFDEMPSYTDICQILTQTLLAQQMAHALTQQIFPLVQSTFTDTQQQHEFFQFVLNFHYSHRPCIRPEDTFERTFTHFFDCKLRKYQLSTQRHYRSEQGKWVGFCIVSCIFPPLLIVWGILYHQRKQRQQAREKRIKELTNPERTYRQRLGGLLRGSDANQVVRRDRHRFPELKGLYEMTNRVNESLPPSVTCGAG